MEFTHSVPYSLKFIPIPLKGGQLSITAQIILHRKKVQVSTGLKCESSEWDSETSNFHPTTAHLRYQMNRLAEFEGKVYESYLALRASEIQLSAIAIKNFLAGKTDIQPQTVLDFMREYTEIIDKRGEYCPATISRYKKVTEYLSTYLTQKGLKSMRLAEMNRSHIVGFQNFLLTTVNPLIGKPISRTTSNGYMKKLHAVINEALALQLIDKDPFAGFKLENVKVVKEFLTLDEVRKLSDYNFDEPHLRNLTKSYLFCATSGLRFSDAMALKRENIKMDRDGRYWISTLQTKTKIPLLAPMFSQAVEIMKYFKEEYPEMETVLPTVTNQYANRALKKIAAKVGIRKNLKFHSSRHTFACSLIERGADLFATSKLMGHTSISSTQIYAQMSSSRVLEVVQEIDKLR